MFVRWRERLVAGSLEHTYWPSSPGVFVGLLVKNTTISTEGGGAKVFSKWKRDGTAAIYTSFLHFVDCRLFSLICKERGVCWWVGCKSVCLFGGHLPKIKEIVHIEFNPDCNLLWIFSSVAFWEIWPLPNDVWWISFIKKPEDTPAKCARCMKHLLIPTAQWDGKWPWKWLSSENQTDPNNLIYIYIYVCISIKIQVGAKNIQSNAISVFCWLLLFLPCFEVLCIATQLLKTRSSPNIQWATKPRRVFFLFPFLSWVSFRETMMMRKRVSLSLSFCRPSTHGMYKYFSRKRSQCSVDPRFWDIITNTYQGCGDNNSSDWIAQNKVVVSIPFVINTWQESTHA